MDDYKKRLADILAETNALFFGKDLVLKDGRPTPYFVNMAMFKTGRLSLELGSFFASMMLARNLVDKTDIILGPSYKGSSIALSTSIALWKDHGIDLPFEYDRKEAKTHGESSGGKNMFVNGTFFDGCRLFIVDDVATSMGTKYELLEKLDTAARTQGIEIQVSAIAIAIDREQTTAVYDGNNKVIPGRKGENAIRNFVSETGIPVYAVAKIKEVINYLYQEKIPIMVHGSKKPLDPETKKRFDEYIDTYGTAPQPV